MKWYISQCGNAWSFGRRKNYIFFEGYKFVGVRTPDVNPDSKQAAIDAILERDPTANIKEIKNEDWI